MKSVDKFYTAVVLFVSIFFGPIVAVVSFVEGHVLFGALSIVWIGFCLYGAFDWWVNGFRSRWWIF